MKCPKCNSYCWRNEVDIEVGVISDKWECTECDWNNDYDWEEWLSNEK